MSLRVTHPLSGSSCWRTPIGAGKFFLEHAFGVDDANASLLLPWSTLFEQRRIIFH